jgi:hypothetical protein
MMGRPREVQPDGLASLEEASREHGAALDRLRNEILAARLAGSSLRVIGEVVGMSPETVRTIVAEEKARRDPERVL